MLEENSFYNIIKELCCELDISLEEMSHNWVLQLTKDGKIRHIIGTRFDINNEAARKYCM